MEVLSRFPSKLSSPSPTPLSGKPVPRAACGPKPPPHPPLRKLPPQREDWGISTSETTAGSLITAGAAQERTLASHSGPRISSRPQMLLRCVSVFVKCFSNKVSIPHRVRTLIKCRTCAVCQLAAEAYLNSFSDTIVLILIFSPCVLFFQILLVLFFFMMCEFSYILYPLTGMSGACFHQWFLRA